MPRSDDYLPSLYHNWRWNHVEPILDEKGYLLPDDRRHLDALLDDLEGMRHQIPVAIPGLDDEAPGSHQYREHPENPQQFATLLGGVHAILERYLVKPEFYFALEHVFQDIGLRPSDDLSHAFAYARRNHAVRHICWDRAKIQGAA